MSKDTQDAAHGGAGWSPRTASLQDEIGHIWAACGVASEWAPLKTVLVHRPGVEIESVQDANKALMLQAPDAVKARNQHDQLVEAYQIAGVKVFFVEPDNIPPPNLMYVADLFFMTSEGAILARPASTVRAGEERFAAKRLAELGVPILRCVRGKGVFEGADAQWINSNVVLLATGLRTNSEGATQVASLLRELNAEVIHLDLPQGTMHLMGTMRFINKDLAICWRTRTPNVAIRTIRDNGYEIFFVPDETEALYGMALNFVTLKPMQILMPSGNPKTQSFYEQIGIKCVTVKVDELHQAAGGIGCLTGIIKRE